MDNGGPKIQQFYEKLKKAAAARDVKVVFFQDKNPAIFNIQQGKTTVGIVVIHILDDGPEIYAAQGEDEQDLEQVKDVKEAIAVATHGLREDRVRTMRELFERSGS